MDLIINKVSPYEPDDEKIKTYKGAFGKLQSADDIETNKDILKKKLISSKIRISITIIFVLIVISIVVVAVYYALNVIPIEHNIIIDNNYIVDNVTRNYTVVLYSGTPYNLLFVETILESIGEKYILFNATNGISNMTTNIKNIILLNDRLLYYNNLWISALNNDEWKYLYNLNVSMVSLYSIPSMYNYMTLISGTSNPTKLYYKKDMTNIYLNSSSILDLRYTWIYRGTPNEEIIRYVDYEDGYPAISINRRFNSSYSMMHLFFDQSIWEATPIALSRIWLSYLDILPINEKIFLSCQVDDVFLSTKLFNKTETYRTSVDDFQHLINFQNSLGINYKTEMAYNGKGVYANNGPLQDPLFIFSYYNRNKFNWLSHTFSHQNLNNVSYIDSYNEQYNNIEQLELYLVDNFDDEYNSHRSMVTPQISGLFNGNALKGLYDNNIRNIVGDNTRHELIPKRKYGYINSSIDINGFDGMMIIPRWATVIYYDCSTIDENVSQYNSIYRNFWGYDLNFNEIIKLERERVARLLLLRHWDAYMFHQANLRVFDYNDRQASLIQLWIEQVIQEIRKYVLLPIGSVKQKDLAEMFIERYKNTYL